MLQLRWPTMEVPRVCYHFETSDINPHGEGIRARHSLAIIRRIRRSNKTAGVSTGRRVSATGLYSRLSAAVIVEIAATGIRRHRSSITIYENDAANYKLNAVKLERALVCFAAHKMMILSFDIVVKRSEEARRKEGVERTRRSAP
ncbi:hypothetical protein ALC56_03313 [Trachymyrmex septentrionalis]|uniref:Uncharacterized protein n=1 Tax=Trachymyrmex septentrionalis TaxID=34720 RepID=A0A195FNP7_9HYME|nr:hypothetical protein ALC56_03313 [Trachymyrmex septentrionalis]